MTVEEAIEIVESVVDRGHLNKAQEIVFRQSWEGRSYTEIASNSDYELGYIRDTGSKLWQALSRAFGKKVTKNNLHGVLKRQNCVTHANSKEASHICAAEWQPGQETVAERVPTKKDTAKQQQDWGDAIDVSVFYNRTAELATLQQWILQHHCRLITIYGMGGMGKTALAAKLAQQVQSEFQYLVWRSLRNAPPLEDLILELIQFLSQGKLTELPTTLDSQILQLLEYLRSSRCLLILDNAESILQYGDHAGCYQAGYESYGQLLKCVAETSHSSCLMLTSREKAKSLVIEEGEKLPVRSLRLQGLDVMAGREIVQSKGKFWASEAEWQELIEHYAGNPLALKMVVPVIQDLFNSSVSQFLACLNQGPLMLDDIRQLLDQHYNRLSGLEKQLMSCLAARFEPVSFLEMLGEFGDKLSCRDIIIALASLQRRSLVLKVTDEFTLIPLVREFIHAQV